MTVAPVVVSADMDSKTASTKEICSSSENKKGTDPDIPSTVQNKTTTKKPSRRRNSLFLCLTGSQRTAPIIKTNKNPLIKGETDKSP